MVLGQVGVSGWWIFQVKVNSKYFFPKIHYRLLSYFGRVEAKTQLVFSYASISTELLLFVVSNHNSWVLASTIA
jgi:hypothetical protein